MIDILDAHFDEMPGPDELDRMELDAEERGGEPDSRATVGGPRYST